MLKGLFKHLFEFCLIWLPFFENSIDIAGVKVALSSFSLVTLNSSESYGKSRHLSTWPTAIDKHYLHIGHFPNSCWWSSHTYPTIVISFPTR